MKTRGYILFGIITSFLSCQPFVDDYLFVPEAIETAAVVRSQYISHTSSELVYEIEVVLLASYEFLGDNLIIFENQFQFVSNSGTTQVLDFDGHDAYAPPGNSSTIVMIDESGSYEETDPANARSQVINKFLNDHQAPDNFMLAAFSKEGNLVQEPVEYFREDFSTAWNEPLPYIFDLARRTGGKSSLFDAVYQAIDKLVANGTNEQKELVVLVHSPDAGSNTALSSILQKAKTNNVRLHFIELSKEPNESLISLSQQTGGIYVACPTSLEMICAFNHFERLLNGKSYQHRLRLRYKPTGTVIQSGFELRQAVKVTESYDNFKYNSAYLYVKVP